MKPINIKTIFHWNFLGLYVWQHDLQVLAGLLKCFQHTEIVFKTLRAVFTNVNETKQLIYKAIMDGNDDDVHWRAVSCNS